MLIVAFSVALSVIEILIMMFIRKFLGDSQ